MPPFLLIIEYLFLQVAAQSVLTRRRAKTAVDFPLLSFSVLSQKLSWKMKRSSDILPYYSTTQLSFLLNTDLKLWKFHLDHEKAGLVKTRVSVQGVKSLGGHFACLCQGFEFNEVKKNCHYLFFREKIESLLRF